MNTKALSQLLVLMGIAVFYASCDKNYVEPKPVITPTVPPIAPYQISFSGRIIPIFNAGGCDGCHDGGAIKPDLKPANAYTSLFVFAQSGIPVDTVTNKNNPENNLLYLKVKPGGSMNGKLSSPSDADSILVWLQQGAKNN